MTFQCIRKVHHVPIHSIVCVIHRNGDICVLKDCCTNKHRIVSERDFVRNFTEMEEE